MRTKRANGAYAVMESLVAEGVDTIFGYPGGAIMPVYDALYDYTDRLKHLLVRHEQGAVHAAEGYARATGKTGVCFVTSGPGATNAITGIADADMDSTPLVVICGQVHSAMLGTDAFQETHFTRITRPITKWSVLVKRAEDITKTIAMAFHIARSGRPGPVVIDITKDAQLGALESISHERVTQMRSCPLKPQMRPEQLAKAAEAINESRRPMVIIGHGIQISGADAELKAFLEKTNFPVASSLLGLSTLPTQNENFVGMLGMHGCYAPNLNLNKCDLVIGIGVRFDDRLTSKVATFAKDAKILHVDIDAAEIGKILNTDYEVEADAKDFLSQIIDLVDNRADESWLAEFRAAKKVEQEQIVDKELNPQSESLKMAEVVHSVTSAYGGEAIVVTDVGQQQMFAARYAQIKHPRSFICSGGLGTMGFGLPAAMGAKVGRPDRDVCLFVGDGGIQMNIQEFATIMQYGIDVKVFIMNNSYLGLVRQWQEMFFQKRYSSTPMINPDFSHIAQAYGVAYVKLEDRTSLEEQIQQIKGHKGTVIVEVIVEKEDNVFPMVPSGASLYNVLLK